MTLSGVHRRVSLAVLVLGLISSMFATVHLHERESSSSCSLYVTRIHHCLACEYDRYSPLPLPEPALDTVSQYVTRDCGSSTIALLPSLGHKAERRAHAPPFAEFFRTQSQFV